MAGILPAHRVTLRQRISTLQRKPRRVTITLNHATYVTLQTLADEQGRSLSNLCAHYLEIATSG